MELVEAADLSIHICPACHHAYRLSGVRPGQEIVCFKCGEVFRASQNFKRPESFKSDPPKNEPLKKEPSKMTQAPALHATEPIADTAFAKPKPQGGSWTWLVFLSFVLFCFVKAVSLPVDSANFASSPMPRPAAPTAEAVSPQTLQAEATALFDSKQFAPAAEKFAAFLAAAPKTDEQAAGRLDAWWKLGMAREQFGDAAGAVAAYEGMLAEFGKEKDWKLRVAKKSLERLKAGSVQ